MVSISLLGFTNHGLRLLKNGTSFTDIATNETIRLLLHEMTLEEVAKLGEPFKQTLRA